MTSERKGICSRRPACSCDPQLGWSYGGGNLGLIRPRGYLAQCVGAFFYYTVQIKVWWEAGAIGLTNHWPANKISGLVDF